MFGFKTFKITKQCSRIPRIIELASLNQRNCVKLILNRFSSGICKESYVDHEDETELRKTTHHPQNYDFKKMRDDFRSRVIFHSYYKYEGFLLSKQKEDTSKHIRYRRLRNKKVLPVCLKYLIDEKDRHLLPDESAVEEVDKDDRIVLPFEVTKVRNTLEDESKEEFENTNDVFVDEDDDERDVNEIKLNKMRAKSGQWMEDYEYFEDEEDIIIDSSQYGTPSLAIPMSNTPCGGCGAFLHCQDPGIPGYIPSEIFINCNTKELRGIKCQRCHFMENYKMALTVSVDPEEYPRLLSRIKNRNALVIMMVDMTDFPCSIWPGILDIIGPKQPLFVVGNKVDLLVGDHKDWVRRAKLALDAALPKNANVKHSMLISAKTGFGVEELINNLHLEWQYKGDVYLIGCTNVGKSTLFNALIQSDYCKVQAIDIMQRATTSPWPGTTLNLLRFPILRSSGYRMLIRSERLLEERKSRAAHKRLSDLQSQGLKPDKPVSLAGHIGRSFTNTYKVDPDVGDPFGANSGPRKVKKFGLDPNDPDFKDSKWFYDTPGVVQPDQIIDLLTTEELIRVLPRTPIHHRVYILRVGQTILIAGLARLDFVEGDCDDIRVVVFKPDTLPVTICETQDADGIYRDYLGTKMLVVPSGGPDRLAVWPNLQPADDIVLKGVSENECCADIVLSNAGWISLAHRQDMICKFRAWTPNKRGIHVRTVPLFRYAIQIRGKRVSKMPTYNRAVLKQSMDG